MKFPRKGNQTPNVEGLPKYQQYIYHNSQPFFNVYAS